MYIKHELVYLDCLIVDEGVYGSVASLILGPVHVYPELGPPLGDAKGEGSIGANAAHSHTSKLPPTLVGLRRTKTV